MTTEQTSSSQIIS